MVMATSIAVCSGKGGVGKTSVSVNLALIYRNLGKRVTIFDADFGMANSHILMGVNPQYFISDVLNGSKSMTDIMCKGPNGVTVLSGGTGLLEVLNIDRKNRYEVIRLMDELEDQVDILIIDVPAGASDNSVSFVSAADRAVVVLVGEPTSFLDAYSFIKAANLEMGTKDFTIAVNMANSETEAKQHFDRFNAIAMKFLDVRLRYGGHIPHSKRIRASIVNRKPIVTQGSDMPETLAFQKLAKQILSAPINVSNGIRFFHHGESEEA
jgi:flagellar biosynthesis protein FlhG